MKLHSTMSQTEWNDLLNFLTANGAHISHIAETDNNRAFVRYKYVLIEYKDAFYYMQNPLNMFEPFEVTRYLKVNPYERQQNAYPITVHDTDELIAYMEQEFVKTALKGTYKQRIYQTDGLYTLRDGHTDLWRLENELAGYREKAILINLAHITMQRNTKDYCVLRFHSSNGDLFDYETKSKRITQ